MKNLALAFALLSSCAALAGDLAKEDPRKPELLKIPTQLLPTDVVLKDGPPSLPKGTQVAVLEGDPTKEGIVTMRLRMPKSYRLPAHLHGADERVTVLEGKVWVAFTDKLDDVSMKGAKAFPAGSFYINPQGVHHAVFTGDEGALIQITVQGPWTVTYVDVKDDPRAKK
jgi:quercetin dioxygenase-like cupin family protein